MFPPYASLLRILVLLLFTPHFRGLINFQLRVQSQRPNQALLLPSCVTWGTPLPLSAHLQNQGINSPCFTGW